jgi:GTP-binding protein HflX
MIGKLDEARAGAEVDPGGLPRGCALAWSEAYDHAYAAEANVDVPADGSAAMGYVTVPRESTDVFRMARIVNPLSAPLLPGPVDVYVGGDFLMTGRVAFTAPDGELLLGLGVELILDIFAQRAESADGKLQVELAQLKYALPRLAQKDDSLSRLTGGIGGRGPGETKLEIGRRRARERVTALEGRLKKLAKQRRQRRSFRKRQNVPIVSIVGYTNAGKSTLLNTLTQSQVLAENRLFATLDTRSRRLRFPEDREVVITDTVGFIRDLPKDLFAAFRATFEETADADLLLHVVDAADPDRDRHMDTTDKLLSELDLGAIPRILVFNKADLLDEQERQRILNGRHDAVMVSAIDRTTTIRLLDLIAERLHERWEASRLVPATPLALVAE